MAGQTNEGPTLYAVSSILLVITTFTVVLRCYARITLAQKFSIEDGLLLFGYTTLLVQLGFLFEAIRAGIGKHLIDVLEVDPEHVLQAMKYFWLSQLFYVISICAVKNYFAVFFYNLRPSRCLRISAICAAILAILIAIGYATYIICVCSPTSYFWNQLLPTAEGTCIKNYISYRVIQVLNSLNIFSDVLLAILPCIMVWNLNMKRAQKILVSILLGISILPAIVSIFRGFFLERLLFNIQDFTYYAWIMTITEVIEPSIGISIICLAQSRPLLEKIVPARWRSAFRKSSPSAADRNIVTFGQQGGRTKKSKNISLDDLIDKTHGTQYIETALE